MDISKHLKENGPALSTVITDLLVKGGVKPDTARKRISRAVASGKIRRLKGITFPKGVSFIYHEESYATPEYWDALLKAIDETNPTYSAALSSLRVRGGIVPLKYFSIISGSPVRQEKQIASDAVLERLKSIEILRTVNNEEFGEYVTFNERCYINKINLTEFKAQQLAENILLSAVRDWARKLNIVSYDAVQCRDDKDELPKVGTFNWDMGGPSFLSPFFHKGKTGNLEGGFFVCDVAVDAVFDEKAINAFIRKYTLMSYLKLSPILFCIVAKGFTPDAFSYARSKGIMVCTIENLLGKDVAEGLSSLIKTLSKMAEMVRHRPEIIDEIFSKIGHIEGAAKNIRGSLFEFLVGHCVVQKDDGSIDIGKEFRDLENGKSYEVDVFRVKERREVWVYECKAHQPTEIVKLEDVKFWYEERVIPLVKILKNEQRFRDSKLHFEYWTCGGFDEHALQYLKEKSEKTKKYHVGFKDGNMVRDYIKSAKLPSVLKSFDEHFFRNPMSKVEKRFVRKSDAMLSEYDDLSDFLSSLHQPTLPKPK